MRALIGWLSVVGALSAQTAPVPQWESVAPILRAHCAECHGPDVQRKSLRLDVPAGVARGGRSGPVVQPGAPDASRLLQHVLGEGGRKRMPPDGPPLAAADVARLRAWIAGGAPGLATAPPADLRPWSYRPLAPPQRVAGSRPVSLDALVAARIASAGVGTSPPASATTWLRRVSLDLTGLPPTLAELDAFAADDAEGARERAVDRLLMSRHFGERQAAWWLDLARYADTKGYEKDERRSIWRYRDWVIDAFNRNLPFDQFTIEQLAGDLLPDPTLDQLVATAFHRNTMTNDEGGTDDEEFRVAAVVDRVNTTAQVWLGMTAGCAQCHDHKYDPLSQREYYELFAFFDQTEDDDHPTDRPVIEAPTREQQAQLTALREEQTRLRAATTQPVPEQFATEVRARLDAIGKEIVALAVPTVPILRERPAARARATRVHRRGSFLDPGEVVTPGVPSALHPFPADLLRNRLGFARWLVSPDNPLFARVLVNRVWEQLFGRGLVRTSEDFGSMGERPSHPELLDWLASRFVASGYDLKALLRTIVLSATYGRSSIAERGARGVDQDNVWLARGPRERVDAEAVRDIALVAAGLLDPDVGGPSVMPYQPEGVWSIIYSNDQWRLSEGSDRYRRGLYTFWRRTSPYPAMLAFDAPSREYCVGRRITTNTPAQALVTLNDPAFVEAARALGRRMQRTGSVDAGLVLGFRACTARIPDARELNRLRALFTDELARSDGDAAGYDRAWTIVGNVLLNLDETLTKG